MEHLLTLLPSTILQKRFSGIGLGPLHRGFLRMTIRMTNRRLHEFSREDASDCA